MDKNPEEWECVLIIRFRVIGLMNGHQFKYVLDNKTLHYISGSQEDKYYIILVCETVTLKGCTVYYVYLFCRFNDI